MQPAPRPRPSEEEPLPPALTRPADEPAPLDAGTLAAPFVPGFTGISAGDDVASDARADTGPSSGPLAPLPWEAPQAPDTIPLGDAAPDWQGVHEVEPEAVFTGDPATPRDPGEPLMPWEEYLTLGADAPAAPAPDEEWAPAPEVGAIGDPWDVPSPEPEEGVAAAPWDEPAQAPEPEAFPLDAFIVPADAQRPAGMEDQRALSEALATRLEALASRLRVEGIAALAHPGMDGRPIDQVLGAILAGYLSRET